MVRLASSGGLRPPEHFYAHISMLKSDMAKHKGIATLQYYVNWAIAYIDPEIGRYYRSVIPAYFNVQPQMHRTHITVVRKDKEIVQNWGAWNKYPGRQIVFYYEPTIMHDETYFWIPAWSDEIGDIREELGLPRVREGYTEYHITLANIKPTN